MGREGIRQSKPKINTADDDDSDNAASNDDNLLDNYDDDEDGEEEGEGCKKVKKKIAKTKLPHSKQMKKLNNYSPIPFPFS